MQWIMALRPSSGVATSLLVVSGFRHSNLPINWSVVIAVFLLTCLAMLWNDYHDREADVAKGRLFANSHPVAFRRLALAFSIVSLGMSLYVLSRFQVFGFLCVAMWLACMVYPFAQRNALAKNMIVSLTMAATVVFPLLEGADAPRLWLMAAFIATVVSIREHAKDVVDIEVDKGKKKTFALVLKKNFSKREAVVVRVLANFMLVGMMI